MKNDLVSISIVQLGFAVVPLFLIALITYQLELELTSEILTGTFRSFIQLSILGFILHPIFEWGEKYPVIVIIYTFLMVLIASYEACSRTKYTYPGIYLRSLASMLAAVAIVSVFAFGIIIRPDPPLSPQYVIPIVGMLLGNCLNGISLSLNSLMTSLVEQKAEIEVYLSFGASNMEAVSRLLRESVKAGVLPTLNGMAIIGLISIPGMMTGQILGGSSVLDAARYQILIMYLIALCCFTSILLNSIMVLRVAFGDSDILQTRLFRKRTANASISHKIKTLLSFEKSNEAEQKPLLATETQDLYTLEKAPRLVTISSNPSAPIALELNNVTVSVPIEETRTRTLVQNLSFTIRQGETIVLEGPSGSGKSQVLRAMAALRGTDSGSTILSSGNKTEWRKKVRYVAQTKVLIPGSTNALIDRILSFASWRNISKDDKARIKESVTTILRQWGLSISILNDEISTLSGGEAQRVFLALALASKPHVLLLDESTSALDLEMKQKVERLVKELTSVDKIATVWVTHDPDQAERIANVG